MASLRRIIFGDAPVRAMLTLGLKYGAADLIAQQAASPGCEINQTRAGTFLAFGTYYGLVNYTVFRALAWSPWPVAPWPKALFSAFFDGCVHVPILLYPQPSSTDKLAVLAAAELATYGGSSSGQPSRLRMAALGGPLGSRAELSAALWALEQSLGRSGPAPQPVPLRGAAQEAVTTYSYLIT